MPRLLVVHHSPSPVLRSLLEASLSGLAQVPSVEVLVRPALTCSAVEALEADAYVLGTPANIGYMSGALKHFFDGLYYLGLDVTRGRPYALWVHGNDDTAGAVRSVEKVADALAWQRVARPVEVTGAPSGEDREAVGELAAMVAASLL